MLSAQEIAQMTATVASSLDTTVTIQRYTATQDGYGHTTKSYTTIGTATVGIIKPTANMLTLYADIIGSQTALTLRFMNGTDIQEGDQIVYQSKNWKVQNVRLGGSYSFSNDALLTEVQ